MKVKQIAIDSDPQNYTILYALTNTGQIFAIQPFTNNDWAEIDTTIFGTDEDED